MVVVLLMQEERMQAAMRLMCTNRAPLATSTGRAKRPVHLIHSSSSHLHNSRSSHNRRRPGRSAQIPSRNARTRPLASTLRLPSLRPLLPALAAAPSCSLEGSHRQRPTLSIARLIY